MLNELRYFVALSCFCLGIYLIWDLINSGFDPIVLGATFLCFILAHLIKPNTENEKDSGLFWDIVDAILEVPYRSISLILRGLSRLLKHDGDLID